MIRIRRFVDWKTREGILQLLGAVFFLLLVVISGRPGFTNASKPPREISNSLIALEQARNVDEVDAILSDSPSPDREVMRIKQYIEIPLMLAFGLITLVASAILLRRNRIAALIGVLGLAASIVALLESKAILNLIGTPLGETTQGMVDRIRFWSTCRWSATAAALTVLSVFLVLGKPWFAKVVGLVNLGSAGLLAAGLGQIPLLPAGAVAAGAATVLSAVTLKFVRYEESTPRNSVSRSV